MISFFSSYISPLATKYIKDVLDSGMLSEGKVVATFEREFENSFDLIKNSVVMVNSGTSALHLAIETLKGRGEIILPANTFVATGFAIKYARCTPVFCDILPDGTIDPADVKRKITIRTVAVIGVNWAGRECDDRLEKVCFDAEVPLIIDAAQSLGCKIRGTITCLSFQATKHLSTGDGGALIFTSPETYEKAKRLRWFGISKQSITGLLGEREYSLGSVGFKYHMNDFTAALGLANLRNIQDRLAYYKTLASLYTQSLKSVTPLHTERSSYWSYPILVDDVNKFSSFCRDREIPCSIIHRGIDHNPVFGGVNNYLINQRKWEKTVTHLPIHSGMTVQDIGWICHEVNKYV